MPPAIVHPCSLVPPALYPDMDQKDRQCHIPLARIWFKRDNPNTSCSANGTCQACLAHPIYAVHETRLQDLRDLPVNKHRKEKALP